MPCREIVKQRGISDIVKLFIPFTFDLHPNPDDILTKVPKSEEFPYNTRLQKDVMKSISKMI